MLRLEATLIRPQNAGGPFRDFGAVPVFERAWERPIRGFARKHKPRLVTDVTQTEEVKDISTPVIIEPDPIPVPIPTPSPPVVEVELEVVVRAPLAPPISAKAIAGALKKAQKNASAHRIGTTSMMRSSGVTRPMLGSSMRAAFHRTSRTSANAPASRKTQPPFVVTEELLCEIVTRAYRVFDAPRVKEGKQVLAVMFDVEGVELDDVDTRIVGHAMRCVREDVANALEKGVRVNRRFLHAQAMRVFGRLVAEAWKRAKEANPVLDEAGTVARKMQRMRLQPVAQKHGGGGYEVLFWRSPDARQTLYFIVELSARGSRRVIHAVMREREYRAWIGRRRSR